MPPAPELQGSGSGQRGLRLLAVSDLEELTTRGGLPSGRRMEIQAAAALTGFSVTSYVTQELIDWSAVPDDPIWRLFFPSGDAVAAEPVAAIAGLLRTGAPAAQIRAAARQARPQPAAVRPERQGEQVLPGVHRSYHDTVTVILPPGPGGRRRYGLPCPGSTWPGTRDDPAMATADLPRLVDYLHARPEVSIVRFAGTDPLITSAAGLRRYVEPLLVASHVDCIQLDTTALACWPRRLLSGPAADNTLRLFEEARRAGKTVVLLAGFCHSRELEPPAAGAAVRRARSAGAMIQATAPVTGTVNDTAGAWTALWRAQIRMGIVPRTMTVQHVSGPAGQYRVPLARAQQIFARAYAGVSGLARTVRGPAMRDEHGIISIDGTAAAGTQNMFVLRYLQARDPHLTARPFFAAFDPAAAWHTDLRPAHGSIPSPAR